jgi:hypothetical protein
LYSFIAIGGRCNAEQKLDVSENLEIQKLSFADFVGAMNDSDTIFHSLSLASTLLAMNFIKRSDEGSLQGLKKLL